MYGNLYVKQRHGEDLATFTAECRSALGLPTPVRHDSMNYVGAESYICKAMGLEITLARSDDTRFEAYDFWLSWHSETDWGSHGECLDEFADIVAQKLVSCGYRSARAADATQNGPIVHYEP